MRGRFTALVFVAVLGSTAGCGVASGMMSNTDEVCADAADAYAEFGAKLNAVDPLDAAQWQQLATGLSGRLDALANKADDKKVKQTFTEASSDLKQAATSLGAKEVAGLSRLVKEHPAKLDAAC